MRSIIKDFENNYSRYTSYSVMLESLINSLLLNNGIKAHSINSRVKDKESIEKKIERKGTYLKIDDITDVVGVRIITHYSDEVDLIAKIIESEFFVDIENSIDKRKSLAPDRFGYLSLHYIVSLSDVRSNLAENTHYKNFKAEIQIRSILQHTWAEIEHDTGYKTSIEVPHHIRRQFSRLAGLLEIADEQFINIKKSLIEYKDEVSKQVLDDNADLSIYLDSISYEEYLYNSEIVKVISDEILLQTGHTFYEIDDEFYVKKSDYVRAALKQLSYFEIDTVSKLDEALKKNKDFIINRICGIIAEFTSNRFNGPVHLMGVYLSQALSAKNGSKEEVTKFLADNINKKDENIMNLLTDQIMTAHCSANNSD